MLKTDTGLQQALTTLVGQIEQKTAAEVVVVLNPRSDTYPESRWQMALIGAFLGIAFLCWSPWPFDALYFPIDIALIAALNYFIAWRRPQIAYALVPQAQRQQRVRAAAESAFIRESVHATEERTGVLVYISLMEAHVIVLPDQGLLGRIPGSAWSNLNIQAKNLPELEQGLQALGALLAQHFPRREDDRNELPDAPRVYET